MGYFSCNAESAIATCDADNWPHLKKPRPGGRSTKPLVIRHFSHAELFSATDGFSAASFLGKGSHGSVYKAVLDDGRLTAAVKITKLPPKPTTSFHDNEIEVLSRVRHPRLVNLLGFSAEESAAGNKLIVVEYMPNGSLYDALHSRSGRVPGWTRRVRFGLQVAKAVHALHSSIPPVIHRDIKSSNVLIDRDGDARLGDFGLALRGHAEDVRVRCTPPAGTLGYLDPAYLAPSDLTAKSDVFSFGILLLEIISGRNAIDVKYSPPSIVDWASPIVRRGDYGELCDPRIGPPADIGVARGLAVLAARCVKPSAEKRPGMSEVIEGLKAVRKRAHAPPVWFDIRRRVSCAEVSTQPLLGHCQREVHDETEPPPAPRNDAAAAAVGRVVRRSKSIGSADEIDNARRRVVKGGGVAVKMPAVVRLSKSRSVGGGPLPRGRRVVLEFDKRDPHGRRCDLSNKLVISLDDEKCEKELLEKPLFSITD